MLKPLSRLIIGDDERGYSFTHPGLGDYFRGKLTVTEQEQYQGRFLTWGAQTVQALRSGKLKPEDVPPYLIRYYAAHLDRSGAEPTDLLQLVSDAWHRASEIHEHTNAVFLEDGDARLARGAPRTRLRWRRVRSPLSVEIRCAAVCTNIHLLASCLTPFLISSLVENGLWPIEVALAYARHEPKPPIRCLGLITLAGITSEPLRSEVLEEVVDTALAIENMYWLHSVVEEMAPQLPPALMERARARIDTFPSVAKAAQTLAILAHHAPEWAQRALVTRSLELARLLDGYERSRVLSELGSELIKAHGGSEADEPFLGKAQTTPLDARHFLSLASEEDFPAVRENARAALDMSWKVHVTAKVPDLPASLPAATIRTLLNRVRVTCSEEAYATALEILAPQLEGALLEEAVRVVRQNQLSACPVEAARSSSLPVSIASKERDASPGAGHCSESRRRPRSCHGDSDVGVSSLRVAEERGATRCAEIRSGLAPKHGRLVKLAAMVQALPQPKRAATLGEVLHEAEAASAPSTWVRIIEALGPAASDPRLWSALERFSPLPRVAYKQILEFAGHYLPESWMQGALDFALKEPSVVIDFLTVEKRAVLQAIAPRLQDRLQDGVVERLQQMRSGTAVECIQILGPYLGEWFISPLMRMSKNLREDRKAVVLAVLLPRMPEAERPAVLEEAFRLITKAIPRSYEHGHLEALRVLAPHLDEPMLSRAVEAVQN